MGSVRDLMTEAEDDQKSRQATVTEGSPLKQVPTLLQGHIDLSPSPLELESSYALGWIRKMLPRTSRHRRTQSSIF